MISVSLLLADDYSRHGRLLLLSGGVRKADNPIPLDSAWRLVGLHAEHRQGVYRWGMEGQPRDAQDPDDLIRVFAPRLFSARPTQSGCSL